MPRKSKRNLNFALNSSTMSINQQRIADGEVFRNFFAVVDDIDPHEALKHLKDMFRGKLDGDVVTMIFTECGYNVNQALENLMALNDDNQNSNGKLALENICSLSKSSYEGLSYNCDTTCLPASLRESNAVGESSFVTNAATKNQVQCNNPNFTSFSNLHDDASEDSGVDFTSQLKDVDFTSQLKDDTSLKESPELKNQQPAFEENLKTITSHQNTHSSVTAWSMETCASSPSKTSISLSMSPDVKPVMPTNDTFLFPNSGNIHNFATPEKPNCDMILHTLSNFKSRVTRDISPVVGNSNPVGCDYGNDNNSVETLFSMTINNISKKVSSGLPVLVILRGLPGSGKSTLAKQLKSSGSIFSTDDYFYVNGKYIFDYIKLSEAHEWNRKRTIHALKMGVTPVIIDNTNIESWEMVPYIKLGLNHQYEIQVLEPNTPWKFKPGKLAKKNLHKISREKIKRMLDRYDSSKHIGELIESYRAIFIQEGKIRPSKFYKVPRDRRLKDETHECSVSSDRNSQNNHSSEKHFVTESCNQDPDNVISLEAVVHQADESDDSEMSSVNNKDTYIEDVPNADSDSIQFSNLQTELKIGDLNNLKLLTQEDSEESHSTISQQLPSADSNQELSGWEDITELDKDFVWTTDEIKSNFNDVSDPNSELGSKSPNLQDTGETLSIMSLESSESSTSSSSKSLENRTLGQKSRDEIHEDSKKLHDRRSSTQVSTSTSFEICSSYHPKPGRSNLLFQTRSQILENDSKVTSIINEKNTMAWEDVDDINFVKSTWDDRTGYEKKIFDIKEIHVPKPQRLLNNDGTRSIEDTLNSFSPFEQNNEIAKNTMNSDQSVNDNENRSKHDWQFPAFPSGFLPLTYVVDKNLSELERKSVACSKSQTEAEDFVLLNEVERNPLCISNFKILVASDRSKETSLFHQSKNIEKSSKNYKSPHYEKSTSTDDISENIELLDKVKTLKNCFPRICEEDLKHFLELCHGDETWLTNILLEWGYKYNNPLIKYMSIPNIPEDRRSSVTSDWSYVQQPDKCALNTPRQINSSITAEWSYLQQFQGNLNVSKEIISSVAEDWPYGQQLNDSVSNTWEEINNSTSIDWSDTQQFNETFINSSQKPKFNDIEGNTSVPENSVGIEKVNMFDNREEKDLNDRQKSILDKLTLTVDYTLASALEEIFGPVTDKKSGPLPSSYRRVTLNFDTAKILYDKWKETVQSLPFIDEKSKSPLPETNDMSLHNRTHQAANEPLPLSEIMDMEYALQLQQKEQMEHRKHNESYLAVKLKRQKIYEMFPGVDPIALDDVFESNNCSLSQTIVVLEEHLGKPAKTPGKPFSSPNSPQAQVPETHIPDFVNQDWSDQAYPDAYTVRENSQTVLESTISIEAESLRNEAVQHYQTRKEFMNKAYDAHKKGMQQLASFYAQQGSLRKDRFKEANKRASELIIEERNSLVDSLVLDLHGLYVKEAIPLLGKFLRCKKKDLTEKTYGGSQFVTVLTGRGAHSLNGAKLRPSVIKYLKSTGYRFSETNVGIFSINMAACSLS